MYQSSPARAIRKKYGGSTGNSREHSYLSLPARQLSRATSHADYFFFE